MRKALLALSLAACAALPVTAATTPAVATTAAQPGGAAPGSPVAGALDGTTATAAADRFREIRTGERARTAATSIHDDWGVYTSGTAVTGQDAVQSVYRDLGVQSDTLYAPTMKAPGACIELVTAYSGGAKQVWAWDWCVGVHVAKSVNIDANFQANYTTSVNGHDSYRGRVEQTDASRNTWTASLYNFRTGAWNTLYTQSGTDQSGERRSWNVFEIYASGSTTAQYCSALGSRVLESSGYQIKLNGSWQAASTGNTQVLSNSSTANFLCPNLSRQIAHPNDDWQVRR